MQEMCQWVLAMPLGIGTVFALAGSVPVSGLPYWHGICTMHKACQANCTMQEMCRWVLARYLHGTQVSIRCWHAGSVPYWLGTVFAPCILAWHGICTVHKACQCYVGRPRRVLAWELHGTQASCPVGTVIALELLARLLRMVRELTCSKVRHFSS